MANPGIRRQFFRRQVRTPLGLPTVVLVWGKNRFSCGKQIFWIGLGAILGGFWEAKMAPRRPQKGSWSYLGRFLGGQDAPQTAQDGAKTLQDGPRRPKMAPRRAKEAPRRPKMVRRRSKTVPRRFKSVKSQKTFYLGCKLGRKSSKNRSKSF